MLDDIPMSVKMFNKTFPEIKDLHEGRTIDETSLLALLDFIDHRYDCSDFRMVSVIRSLYDYKHLISDTTLVLMKNTVLNFKYHMEDPGVDGMCFWSENHQLIFSAVEYLAGHLFFDEIFINTQKKGIFHKERAYSNLIYWFKTRFELGFVEFHSNTYFEEDIAPLSLLIDLAPDEIIKKQATILMDLLMLDLALHNYRGYFNAASGRCYEMQKKDPKTQDVLDIMKKAFDLGPNLIFDYTRLSTDFILNRTYQVPDVIKRIAHDTKTSIIKDSHGLYLHEVERYFKSDKNIYTTGLYFWSMEAFTNVESIDYTMQMFHDWKLHQNTFLYNLKTFDHVMIKKLKLMKPLIKLLNPTTQGIAIQRANVYTYKHKDYMLSTAQMHVPKSFGDQQHIGGASIHDDIHVFVTHPAQAFFEDNSRNFSPSYWVGNGIMPFAFQHENTSLYVFDLRVRKGMFEKKRALFSHLFFDTKRFDNVIIGYNYILGVKDKTMIGIKTLLPLVKFKDDEFRQYGKVTSWSFHVSSLDDVSIESFKEHLDISDIIKVGNTFTYERLSINTKKHKAYLDHQEVNVEYDRLDTPYIKTRRYPESYTITYDHLTYTLNLKELNRQ